MGRYSKDKSSLLAPRHHASNNTLTALDGCEKFADILPQTPVTFNDKPRNPQPHSAPPCLFSQHFAKNTSALKSLLTKARHCQGEPCHPRLLLHHDLIAIQAISPLTVEPWVGQHVGIENRHVFASRTANRWRQKTGVPLPVNPGTHRVAKRIVRTMQKICMFVAYFSEVQQRSTTSHHVNLALGHHHMALIPSIGKQAFVPVVGRPIHRRFDRC